MNKGKRFFVAGQEVSFEEAIEIDAKNREYMSSNNIADWINIQFIIIK